MNLLIMMIISVSPVSCIKSAMYQKTSNLALSTWSKEKVKEVGAPEHFHCAAACLREGRQCNAWHFDGNTNVCTLANVRD